MDESPSDMNALPSDIQKMSLNDNELSIEKNEEPKNDDENQEYWISSSRSGSISKNSRLICFKKLT